MRTASDLQPSTTAARRWLVIALSCFMVISACSVDTDRGPTEIARDLGTGVIDDAPAETQLDDDASPDTDPAPSEDLEPSEDDSADDDPAEDDTADQPADGRLFELRGGDLPLDDKEVNGLISFIEQEAGRPFLDRPIIVAQTTDEFVAGLAESLEDLEEDADKTVRFLQAIGLTDKGVSAVTTSIKELLISPQGILGHYDPDTAELYVPIDALGGNDFRALLVHELTHSLDGQYRDLTILEDLIDQGDASGDYELVAALQAVVEGRATWIENRWRRENNAPQTVPDLEGPILEIPPAIALDLSVPYAFGELYIDSEGGAQNTWDLLQEPPPSSESFIALGSAEEEIVDVPTPPADGPILDETTMGARDLLVWMLGDSLDPDPAKLLPTLLAVDGWAGGRSVLWGDETESCLRVSFVADSDRDLDEIAEVLEIWVAESPGRTLDNDGTTVTATGCAPYVP